MAATQQRVSIPLGIFRLYEPEQARLDRIVSIPDRVLGIFRLYLKAKKPILPKVSIPDRVLGIFRRQVPQLLTH